MTEREWEEDGEGRAPSGRCCSPPLPRSPRHRAPAPGHGWLDELAPHGHDEAGEVEFVLFELENFEDSLALDVGADAGNEAELFEDFHVVFV